MTSQNMIFVWLIIGGSILVAAVLALLNFVDLKGQKTSHDDSYLTDQDELVGVLAAMGDYPENHGLNMKEVSNLCVELRGDMNLSSLREAGLLLKAIWYHDLWDKRKILFTELAGVRKPAEVVICLGNWQDLDESHRSDSASMVLQKFRQHAAESGLPLHEACWDRLYKERGW